MSRRAWGLACPQVPLEQQDEGEEREDQRQLAPSAALDRRTNDDEHEEQRKDRPGDNDEAAR